MKVELRTLMRFIFIVLLFGALFAYAMFQGGFVSWFLFFSFLPIGIYLVGLYFYPVSKWDVSRKLSHVVVQAGEEIGVTIEIKRKTPFPLSYCLIEDVLPEKITESNFYDKNNKRIGEVQKGSKQLLFPWFQKKLTYSFTIETIPRGNHQLASVRVQIGDVFGFIKKEHAFLIKHTINAYPRKRTVNWGNGFKQKEHAVPSLISVNQANMAMSSREYVPGDNFSWLDWKQTARKNKLMTREFEQEEKSRQHIILDATMYENMNLVAFEAAIEIAFSWVTSNHLLDQPGIFTSIGERTTSFQITTATGEEDVIARHLTALQPASRPFSAAFQQMILQQKDVSLLIVITTRLDQLFTEQLLRVRQSLGKIIVVVIDFEKTISVNRQERKHQLENRHIDVCIVNERQWRREVVEVNRA